MNRPPAAVVLIEAAIYLAAVWYSLPDDTRLQITAAFWHHTARTARTAARTLGQAAITAEANYWKAVSP